jgi:hypothetical protein
LSYDVLTLFLNNNEKKASESQLGSDYVKESQYSQSSRAVVVVILW